jgi:hypothetical protein
MDEVKNFLSEFLEAEAATAYALVKPNLENYNNKLSLMNSFCVEVLQNMFGMIPRTELWDDDFYEEWEDVDSINPRNIFKISHYQDDIYKNIYVVYLSQSNPDNIIFLYGECIFIAKINNELKVIKRYAFGDEMLKKNKFENGLGVDDVSFKVLKKPLEIERYMPPTHDKDGMEHYLADI